MAAQKKGQQDDVQYSIYNPPTSNLYFLHTRSEGMKQDHILLDNGGEIK